MGSGAVGSLATTHDADLDELAGDVIAVDAYIELHQYIHSITDDWGDYVRNDEGEPISHLIGFVSRLGPILDSGIKPVYVFDGGYDELKEDELSSRANPDAKENFLEAKEEGDQSTANHYAHKKAHVTDFMIESTTNLLDAMGVPYIVAPGEAEPQAAQLVQEGQADYVGSQDWDVMLYDVPAMVRDLRTNGCTLVRQDELLNDRDWTLDELRWFAILTGTDYNTSAYQVGTYRGKQIVNKADSFEEVMDKAESYDSSIDRDRWLRVLDLFENQELETGFEPEWQPFNLDAVHAVACDQYGLADWQVQSRMKNVDNSDLF